MGMRKEDVGKGKGVALSTRAGEEGGEIAKLKERMEERMEVMGKFGRLAKGTMLGKVVDVGGEGDDGGGLHR